MAALLAKLIVTLCIALPLFAVLSVNADNNDGSHNLLDVEAPNFFSYNSPLRQPESLRSRPYFDFLSTLYRRDATKSNLFRPYSARSKRAIVFRPLFVYKQQQIKRQKIEAAKKRV